MYNKIKEEIKFIDIPSYDSRQNINNNYICYDISNEKDRQLFVGFITCIDIFEHEKFVENIQKTGETVSNTTYSKLDRKLLESFDKLMENYIPNKFYKKLKQDMIQV